MTRVLIEDARSVELELSNGEFVIETNCVTGIRTFFNYHNLDFRSFVRDGVDSSELEKLNDAMANKAIKNAIARQKNGR